ncbi:MAG TPA: F0F1 ATP synthase subunit B [Gemmatimonadaceae bacterium]|nr:F0F1 ATP synthase subunit B [Gemmatimonadaceae bacterium]HPV77240.1 F0F1 ATP synthase subunit B [Gemmatimonadaceae bacterium]
MRTPLSTALILLATPATAFAAEEGGKVNLLSPNGGLMFWTLLIFIVLLVVLSRYAFKPLVAAVEAREAALESAITKAQQDRDAAAKLLAEQQAQLDAARAEAQTFIADGRATSEKLKASMLEETRAQQQELLERAKRDIENEKLRAIGDLRREAVDLALAGASKLIAKNLDDAGNRKLVEDFLASIPAAGTR